MQHGLMRSGDLHSGQPGILRGGAMASSIRRAGCASMALVALLLAVPAGAAEIGQIKVSKGEVTVEREGKALPGRVGTRLQTSDTVRTGADGSVGITMGDESLLSAGPGSVLSLQHYAFDPTTSRGRFDAALNKGTLAVVSGRIAKQSPDAMTLRTPAVVLGVRGTEFVVSVDD
jgi:hypothetical protein